MPWRKFKPNQEKFCFCDLATLTKDTDYFLNLIHQVLKNIHGWSWKLSMSKYLVSLYTAKLQRDSI